MSQDQDPQNPSAQRRRSLRPYLQSIEIPSLAPAEREILVALKLFTELTVPAMAEILEISTAPLRQHLRQLEGQGLVAHRATHRITSGRPPHLYTLTAEGESLFPTRVSPIGQRALQYLAETDPAALEGILRDMATGTAGREAVRAPGLPGPFRAGSVAGAAALLEGATRSLGFMPDVCVRGSEVVLTFHHCPFRSLVETFPAFCDIERDALGVGLPGWVARRTAHRAAGDRVCAYIIRAGSSDPIETPGEPPPLR